MSKNSMKIYDIVVVGLMAAMVFVCTMFLGVRIPTPTGTTMLKTANAVCLLGGLLFGGLRGGLAAGFGSAFFDLTYPEYAAEAPLTFVRFFLMAFLCGWIAHQGRAKSPSTSRMAVAAVCGGLFDFCFNIGKNILQLVIAGSAWAPAVIATTPKMLTSVINTVFAILVACILAAVLRPRLEQAGLMRKFG